MNISKRKKPYSSRKPWRREKLGGRRANKTLEPSRGVIGTRLKIASRMLINIIVVKISTREDGRAPPKLRKTREKAKAIKIFEPGPAAPTKAGPQRWLERFAGLYGTGLAQPIINPPKR